MAVASRASDGRGMVLDDGFAASTRDDGKSWSLGIAFSFGELNEDFFAVASDDAAIWAKAARSSLSVAPDRDKKLSYAS